MFANIVRINFEFTLLFNFSKFENLYPMKIRLAYSLFALTALAILFWNASEGPAEVQQADRTMSPLSNNTSCGTCHNAGAYSPVMEVQVLDGDMAVNVYEPEKTYTLQVAITGTEAAAFGFQAVALQGEDDVNAGTFGTPPAGIQVTPLNERMYAEHSMPSASNVFSIEWTAPTAGAGNVRIYASGNAANDNNSVTGDQGAFLSSPLVLTELGASSTRDKLLTFEEISIVPNPAGNGTLLTLNNQDPGRYFLTLLNATGQQLQKQGLVLAQGRQTNWIDLSGLPRGLYFLQLSNGQQQLTKKILKQ